MKILLTNDDGYNAPGILALYETLKLQHEVMVVAPERERSAASHSITLNEPIRIHRVNLNDKDRGYAITGTPTDCIKLGLFELYESPPDLVVSGINPGSNTGVNINYSGTAGAAREAALNGIFSIAASILNRGKELDFVGMSKFIAQIINKIDKQNFPLGTFLNINAPDIPIDQVHGVKITRQASYNISRRFKKKVDPRNKSYYWYDGLDKNEGEGNTDVNALLKKYISITPVQCDSTDYKSLNKLESLKLT